MFTLSEKAVMIKLLNATMPTAFIKGQKKNVFFFEKICWNRRMYSHILKSIILIWKMFLLSAVLLKLFVNLHNAWNDFGVCCNMILVKFEVILIEFVCSKFVQSFYQWSNPHSYSSGHRFYAKIHKRNYQNELIPFTLNSLSQNVSSHIWTLRFIRTHCEKHTYPRAHTRAHTSAHRHRSNVVHKMLNFQ